MSILFQVPYRIEAGCTPGNCICWSPTYVIWSNIRIDNSYKLGGTDNIRTTCIEKELEEERFLTYWAHVHKTERVSRVHFI